ncbi:formate dehydrogenase accessory sulfurtransferase FdhD [Candidatus Bathyarchaeota archaeon]|nr:formate dehydrogenase accessory sulfurtransferase FdhD [Candidatus Bathyarchaeota archaeon]
MSIRRLKITRHRDGAIESLEDAVAQDVAVCIFIDGEYYRTLIASPEMTEELVTGHLFTEHIISTPGAISDMKVSPERVDVTLRTPVDLKEALIEKRRLITTACSAPAPISTIHPVKEGRGIDTALIHGIIRRLNEESNIFKQTGGTHSAFIHHSTQGAAAFAEDIGRHNAIDKAIGRCLLDGVNLGECTLASSGRLSAEIILKAAAAGIPTVCSISAPLASGITAAKEAGITLIGFVRGHRMNQYT